MQGWKKTILEGAGLEEGSSYGKGTKPHQDLCHLWNTILKL